MRWEFHPEALEEYQEAVRYYAEADFILIVAVMHGRREPGYWKRRTERE